MTEGVDAALAGLIGAFTVVTLMAGTHFFGPGARRGRNDDDREAEQYRRFRRYLRDHPDLDDPDDDL